MAASAPVPEILLEGHPPPSLRDPHLSTWGPVQARNRNSPVQHRGPPLPTHTTYCCCAVMPHPCSPRPSTCTETLPKEQRSQALHRECSASLSPHKTPHSQIPSIIPTEPPSPTQQLGFTQTPLSTSQSLSRKSHAYTSIPSHRNLKQSYRGALVFTRRLS